VILTDQHAMIGTHESSVIFPHKYLVKLTREDSVALTHEKALVSNHETDQTGISVVLTGFGLTQPLTGILDQWHVAVFFLETCLDLCYTALLTLYLK